MLFEGVRPFDWLMLGVEVAVLLLIAYEVCVGKYRHGKERKRRLTIARIVMNLSEFMDKGQQIQANVPEQFPLDANEYDKFVVFKLAVEHWSNDTSQFLAHHSPRASAAFLLVVDSTSPDSLVYRRNGNTFALHGPLRECYQRLLAQLSNLKNIIEKPDAYF